MLFDKIFGKYGQFHRKFMERVCKNVSTTFIVISRCKLLMLTDKMQYSSKYIAVHHLTTIT